MALNPKAPSFHPSDVNKPTTILDPAAPPFYTSTSSNVILSLPEIIISPPSPKPSASPPNTSPNPFLPLSLPPSKPSTTDLEAEDMNSYLALKAQEATRSRLLSGLHELITEHELAEQQKDEARGKDREEREKVSEWKGIEQMLDLARETQHLEVLIGGVEEDEVDGDVVGILEGRRGIVRFLGEKTRMRLKKR